MNYKIIKTDKKYPDVLLHRDRDENDTEVVEIKAIGTIDEIDEMYALETLSFETPKSAIAFIRDYSKESAEDWCNEFGITI